jgi:hypothetical protein
MNYEQIRLLVPGRTEMVAQSLVKNSNVRSGQKRPKKLEILPSSSKPVGLLLG